MKKEEIAACNTSWNIMCKERWEELLKYLPLEEHTITPYGYDEEEESWEDKKENLKKFLKDRTRFSKILRESLSALNL